MRNSVLTEGFERVVDDETTMTLSGTLSKIGLLMLVLSITFLYSWIKIDTFDVNFKSIFIVAFFGSIILGFLTSLIPRIAQFTAIFYAALEGILIGGMSKSFECAYPGIIFSALISTLVAVILTICFYKKIGSLSTQIKLTILVGTLSLLVVYIIGYAFKFVGINLGIFGAGWIGIIFSTIVVFLSTATLLVDYDFIRQNILLGRPKYMEWYSAFSIILTIIWVYISLLKLLSKLRK